jgi:hypothetical protein
VTRITEEIRPVTAVAKVIPERDFELGAGFGEAKEGITAVTTISLRVPALTFRLVTWQRMSFSDPLVCRISGRSSTINNSRLLALSRARLWNAQRKLIPSAADAPRRLGPPNAAGRSGVLRVYGRRPGDYFGV